MTYKRSKTDSALYCPYCGHGFNMNRERYEAMYHARMRHETYAITKCRYCYKEFHFRNTTPDDVKKTGIKAVLK